MSRGAEVEKLRQMLRKLVDAIPPVAMEDYDELAEVVLSAERLLRPGSGVNRDRSSDETGLPETQEPKYTVRNGRLVNRATGVPIPDEEPIFVFRAQDARAVGILKRYLTHCTHPLHRAAIEQRIEDFEAFARTHAAQMKEPDTAP